MFVIKRNGNTQLFDENKIKKYIDLLTNNLHDSYKDLIKIVLMQIKNNHSTTDILNILINVFSSNIINEYTSNIVAKMLLNKLRKEVWKSFQPQNTLYDRIIDRINKGLYASELLNYYTENEINFIETYIVNYDLDYILSYGSLQQFYDKYLVKNKLTNELYELPQEANILICMYIFMKTPNKLNYIKTMYNYLSNLVISLPTPIYGGVRTNVKQFSSCCVIDCDDNLHSILQSNYIIGKAISERFGIGINIQKIRNIGASVQNNQTIHAGIVPFLKMFESSTKAFMQSGIRGGSSTISYAFWNYEIETLIELKNNKGIVENRVRGIDYSVGLNKFFLERAKQNKNITLFSSEDVPLLNYNYTYTYDEFKSVYENYENSSIRKKQVNALSLLKKIATERYETGRIYIYFMDNMNNYSCFKESIFSSNLCQEIAIPTKPICNDNALIGVCILSCINLGKISNPEELENICYIVVRFLDELIDYQDYSFPEMEISAREYRNLGIGISDLFHYLAKNNLKYDSEDTLIHIHELMEKFQYYLLKSSCELAKEKEKCSKFEYSKYSDLIMPYEQCKNIYNYKLNCDWELLKSNIKKYGLRHTCLSAIPPVATSSVISNSTSGIDPPKSKIITKISKHGTIPIVVPDSDLYNYQYQNEIDNIKYFKLIGVIQKFIDQGISTNSYYMSDKEVSIGDIIKEIFTAYNYGLKTLYYLNSNKGVDKNIDMSNRSFAPNIKKIECCGNGCMKCVNISQQNTKIESENEFYGCESGSCSI